MALSCVPREGTEEARATERLSSLLPLSLRSPGAHWRGDLSSSGEVSVTIQLAPLDVPSSARQEEEREAEGGKAMLSSISARSVAKEMGRHGELNSYQLE
jgi:hypothetical protein